MDRHVVEGGYGKNDAGVAWEVSADAWRNEGSHEPIKLGMKRKMFSYG